MLRTNLKASYALTEVMKVKMKRCGELLKMHLDLITMAGSLLSHFGCTNVQKVEKTVRHNFF